jgi:VIT1/CCC1 family predicted Fe2+/Mn2+ transporter
MAAVAAIVSRVSGIDVNAKLLQTVTMIAGAAVVAFLLYSTYGLDLSYAFF